MVVRGLAGRTRAFVYPPLLIAVRAWQAGASSRQDALHLQGIDGSAACLVVLLLVCTVLMAERERGGGKFLCSNELLRLPSFNWCKRDRKACHGVPGRGASSSLHRQNDYRPHSSKLRRERPKDVQHHAARSFLPPCNNSTLRPVETNASYTGKLRQRQTQTYRTTAATTLAICKPCHANPEVGLSKEITPCESQEPKSLSKSRRQGNVMYMARLSMYIGGAKDAQGRRSNAHATRCNTGRDIWNCQQNQLRVDMQRCASGELAVTTAQTRVRRLWMPHRSAPTSPKRAPDFVCGSMMLTTLRFFGAASEAD